MKAVIIAGSARHGGNTDILCKAAGGALSEQGFSVSFLYPSDMRISHCTNCGGCDDTGVCVIGDDMHRVYDAVSETDIIILGTPVHFSGMSSILKQVVDRFQCLWVKPPENGRKIAGLISDGGSEKPCFRNIISVSKALAVSIGAEWGGEVTIPSTDRGLRDDDVRKAHELGLWLADCIKKIR